MIRALPFAVITCVCFSRLVFANTVVLTTVGSFPYTASSNDTIVVDNNHGVVTVLQQPSRILRIVGGVTGVRVLLDNDTLVFDTDSSSSGSNNECGILIDTLGGSRPSDIVIKGGGIRSPIQLGHGLNSPGASAPSRRHCIWLIDGADITIDSVNLTVDGHNSSCVEWGAFGAGIGTGYNILHRGGIYHNYSESYSDRQNYQSAVCNTDNFTSESGNYTVRMDGVTVIAEGHIGIQTKTGSFQIENCTITVDARNRYWDSVSCFASGTCGTGESSANAYGILMRFPGGGSTIKNCTITSGNSKYGSRGIMIEGATHNSRSNDSVVIEDNYVDVHEGPTGEDNDGTTRVLRIRNKQSSPDPNVWIIARNNTFIGSADNNSGTTAIGLSVYGWDLSHDAGDSTHLVIENNLFRARNLSASGSKAYCTWLGSDVASIGGITIGNNRWEGSQTIIRFNDEDNGIPGNHIAFVGDTFVFIDTTVVTGDPLVKIVSPRTFYLGYDNDNTLHNSVTDGVWLTRAGYVNQASDTNILFASNGANQSQANFTLQRTLSLHVLDTLNHGISGAAVTVKNQYGNDVWSGSTSSDGVVNPVVTYWYEENNHPASDDSIGFNPFTCIASYSGDADTSSFTVTASSFTDTLVLYNTLATSAENENKILRMGRGKLRKAKL